MIYALKIVLECLLIIKSYSTLKKLGTIKKLNELIHSSLVN